ncbi:FMN-binding protein [Clostridium sp. D2Q-14]|uniref:FMN-binding protein n=1 Tax=Anaeromonas gelatinilytica TaxID=2683194 RepID=UPI00193B8F1F|nr:FMN-binding protein [Anaeromonas gelatinilytica]
MKKNSQKNLTVILLIFLLFLIAACGLATSEDNTITHKDYPYKDGTYTGRTEPWEYGREEAIVKIVSGKIDEIMLRKLDNDSKEIDYDNWTGKEVDGQTFPNLMDYRKTMEEEMIEKQTYDIDSISGATITTENWIESVKLALEEASSDEYVE